MRNYLVEGYAIDQKRLIENNQKYKDLQAQVDTLRKVADNETFDLDQSKELVKLISDYARGLDLIDQVDHNAIRKSEEVTNREAKELPYSSE